MTNLIAFCDEMTDSVDEGRAVFLVFSETSDTVSNSIVINKWMRHILYKGMVRWVENWLNCSTKSSWDTITREISAGANTLFNALSDMGAGTECTLSKIAGD